MDINAFSNSIMFFYIAYAAIGLTVASVVGAIWLRLAASFLQFGNVPFRTAFKCTLLSNLFIVVLNFSIGFQHMIHTAIVSKVLSDERQITHNFGYQYPPIYFFYTVVFGLLISAAIISRFVRDDDGSSRIRFSDSLALACAQYACSFVFLYIAAFIISFALLQVSLFT